jgi:protein ImuA
MPSPQKSSRPDPKLIADLRTRIQGLSGRNPRGSVSSGVVSPGVVFLGLDEIDAALPWGGLPRAGLHEIDAADTSAAAAGFCAMVLARLAKEGGVVAWCRRKRGLHGPGLAAFGLDPARLIVVRARNDTDVFWAMEEGLRNAALAAIVGEIHKATPTALRRLQLAAEDGGVTALLLRPPRAATTATPAITRWRVGAAANTTAARNDQNGPVRPRWRVELQKCKSGASGLTAPEHAAGILGLPTTWHLEWRDEAGGFTVVSELRHRSAESAEVPFSTGISRVAV